MAVIKLRRRVKAHADVVWKVISDMSGLAQTAPHVARVEILSGEGKGLAASRAASVTVILNVEPGAY